MKLRKGFKNFFVFKWNLERTQKISTKKKKSTLQLGSIIENLLIFSLLIYFLYIPESLLLRSYLMNSSCLSGYRRKLERYDYILSRLHLKQSVHIGKSSLQTTTGVITSSIQVASTRIQCTQGITIKGYWTINAAPWKRWIFYPGTHNPFLMQKDWLHTE